MGSYRLLPAFGVQTPVSFFYHQLIHYYRLYVVRKYVAACYQKKNGENYAFSREQWNEIRTVTIAFGHICIADKLYKDTTTASGLVAVAIAHALALTVAVSTAMNISGGHVNPAVTFGALLGGRISLIRALFYWAAQLLGAIVAAVLLRITTGGMVTYYCHHCYQC